MRDWDDEPERRHWGIYFEFWLLLGAFLITATTSLLYALPANAHPGGLAADGCHNDRKNGGRHCHSAAAPQPVQTNRLVGSSANFANCAAARAAGAVPVRRGQRGYGAHLDRDGDGVGCE